MKSLPLRTPQHALLERYDLVLPRGTYHLDVPSARTRLYVAVTTAGQITLRRAPLPVADDVHDAILLALDEVLERNDPTLRLLREDSQPKASAIGADTLRVLQQIGLADPV